MQSERSTLARLEDGHQRRISLFVAHAEPSLSKPRFSTAAPVRTVALSALSLSAPNSLNPTFHVPVTLN